MVRTASAPSLEIRFADFLDTWKAQWRYEPRWPSSECGTGGSPQFRVWVPLLHPARKRLGKVFFVELESRGRWSAPRPGSLPVYRIDLEEEGPDKPPVFLFRGPDGRVCLRAS